MICHLQGFIIISQLYSRDSRVQYGWKTTTVYKCHSSQSNIIVVNNLSQSLIFWSEQNS